MQTSVFPHKELDSKTGLRTRKVWRVKYFCTQKNKERTKNFSTKALANHFAKKLEDSPLLPAGYRDYRISELFEMFIEALRIGSDGKDPREPWTLNTYQLRWNNHLESRMSVLRTSNISKKDIVKLRKDLLSAEVSRYTAKMAFELLKNMFRWANDDDLIHVDPAAGLTIASTSKKLQVLHNQEDDDFSVVGDVNLTHTPTQMQTIYDLADKWATTKGNRQKGWINLRTLFRMYLFTGMRSSEILGLPVRHVDLNNRRIRIRQKLDRYGNVGPVKSVFGIREVPILPELLELLTIHIEGKDKDDFVFSTEGGNPLGYRNILRSMWYNLQEGAGLKKKGVHALRHFYGSALVVSGTAREHLVQKLMGHHSPEFTKNIYAHLFCDEYDLALDSLARVERGEFQVSVSLMQDFKNIEKII